MSLLPFRRLHTHRQTVTLPRTRIPTRSQSSPCASSCFRDPPRKGDRQGRPWAMQNQYIAYQNMPNSFQVDLTNALRDALSLAGGAARPVRGIGVPSSSTKPYARGRRRRGAFVARRASRRLRARSPTTRVLHRPPRPVVPPLDGAKRLARPIAAEWRPPAATCATTPSPTRSSASSRRPPAAAAVDRPPARDVSSSSARPRRPLAPGAAAPAGHRVHGGADQPGDQAHRWPGGKGGPQFHRRCPQAGRPAQGEEGRSSAQPSEAVVGPFTRSRPQEVSPGCGAFSLRCGVGGSDGEDPAASSITLTPDKPHYGEVKPNWRKADTSYSFFKITVPDLDIPVGLRVQVIAMHGDPEVQVATGTPTRYRVRPARRKSQRATTSSTSRRPTRPFSRARVTSASRRCATRPSRSRRASCRSRCACASRSRPREWLRRVRKALRPRRHPPPLL